MSGRCGSYTEIEDSMTPILQLSFTTKGKRNGRKLAVIRSMESYQNIQVLYIAVLKYMPILLVPDSPPIYVQQYASVNEA